MELADDRMLCVPMTAVWAALDDPGLLARCAPGCERLDPVGDGEYDVIVVLGVAAVKGRYRGRLSLTDRDLQGDRASLHVQLNSEGGDSFLQGEGDVWLERDGDATRMRYQADVTVGGRVAGVGQRVLRGVGKMLIGQFFNSLERELRKREAVS